MKNALRSLAFVCLLAFVCSCHKHKSAAPIPTDDPQDSLINARFSFKVGTYWIFRDSLNGRIDSFFVTNNFYQTVPGPYVTVYLHWVSVSEHNADGKYPADSALWMLNLQKDRIVADYDYHYGTKGYGWGNYTEYFPLTFYPFVAGEIKSDYYSATAGIDSFYTLHSMPFYNVEVMHQSITLDSGFAPGYTTINDWFYLNDSVCLIKMRLSHPVDSINHVWELQRYNIVK